jgi:hypothetical protein
MACGGRTDGGGDVGVEVGGGDEADEEAALADARVPDEEDLEGALVAAAAAAPRTRRPHPNFPSDSARPIRWRGGEAGAECWAAERHDTREAGGGIEGAGRSRRWPAAAPRREEGGGPSRETATQTGVLSCWL